MEQTTPQNSIKYLKFDPNGDTLITVTVEDTQSTSADDTEKEVVLENRFLVSKKHLMLASRRASKVLGGSFKEAIPEEDGLFHWNFEPIFDPKAFEIVMQIIHGQTRNVPEELDVRLFAQIAAIVDDLECQDSIWFFAKRWLSQIQNTCWNEMSEDLTRLILISFVFEEPETFKKVTHIAMRYSTDVMPALGLPIRPKILEDIDEQREIIFVHLLDGLQDLQSQLLEQSLGCNHGCRAMMYGTLSQAMKSSSLLPPPLPPYTTLSIDSALRQLSAVKGIDYYCPSQDDTIKEDTIIWSVEGSTKEMNMLYSHRSEYHFSKKKLYSSYKPEEVHPKLVRHNCRIEDHLKGLLATTEANEMMNYASDSRKIQMLLVRLQYIYGGPYTRNHF